MWNVIAPMVAGFAVDKMMGGNGVQGAIGGATMGYGSGATAAGGKGAMAGNTAANSAFAGNALGAGGMATGGSALGMGSAATGLSAGLNTGLQNVTNQVTGSGFQPQNITETLGNSFSSAIPETSQVVNNSYVPFGNDYGTTSNFGNSQLNGTKGIGPNMSAQQTFLDTTPDISQGNFGTPQQLNYADEMGMQRQLTHGYTDGVANKTNTNIGANFNTDQITKSTPSDLKLAQGGYEKPLYEKAFDSVMSYASENPIQMAALGLTAFGDKGTSSNTAPPRSGGGSVSRSPFVRMKQPILNVRRTV